MRNDQTMCAILIAHCVHVAAPVRLGSACWCARVIIRRESYLVSERVTYSITSILRIIFDKLRLQVETFAAVVSLGLLRSS